MTALIGGALLLIVVASITLVMGWGGTNESLIYASIAASVGSFVCLALAYYKSRSEAQKVVAAADSSEAAEQPTEAASQPRVAPSATASEPRVAPRAAASDLGHTQPVPAVEPEVTDARAEAAHASETALDESAGAPGAASGAQRSPESGSDGVVAFPQRKKFHRPSCRYAAAGGGERMTKAEAEGRGYDACRLCKP